MDPSIVAGLFVSDNPKPFDSWNSYTSNTIAPIFVPSNQSTESFISDDINQQLQAVNTTLNQRQYGNVYGEVAQQINSVNGIVPTSKIYKNNDVNNLMTLHAMFDLIGDNMNVLSFSPYILPMLAANRCRINLVLTASELLIDKEKKISLSNPRPDDNQPYDAYYFNILKKYPASKLMMLQFRSASVEDRWTVFTKSFQNLDNKVHFIYIDEEAHGYLKEYSARNTNYNIFFFESVFKSLTALNGGGSMVLKMFNFGNRFSADLIYTLKFMFDAVSLIKPGTSNSIDVEYYIVLKGFRVIKHLELVKPVNDMLTVFVAALIKSGGFSVGSFSRNTNLDVNFVRWLVTSNDKIAHYVFSNWVIWSNALEDRKLGFGDSHPTFKLDHTSYRNAIGLKGRTTLQNLETFAVSDQIMDDTIIKKMTETGQLLSDEIPLEYVVTNNTPSLAWYVTLVLYSQQLARLPAFTSVVNQNSQITKNPNHNDYKTEAYRNLAADLRQWLALLYQMKDINRIWENHNEMTNILNQRKWTVNEITSKSGELNIERLYAEMQASKSIRSIFEETIAKLPTAAFKIDSLTNLRFRLSFTLDRKEYALMESNFAGLLDEYGLTNLLTSSELNRITEHSQLITLIKSPQFSRRAVSYASLNSFGAGYVCELSVPDLYLLYKPEMEFFASAVNRFAPKWCSANPDDVNLGSSGDFFGPISDPKNPIYSKLRLAVAFPPQNERIVTQAFKRCVDLLLGLPGNSNLAIIFVYTAYFNSAIENMMNLEDDNLGYVHMVGEPVAAYDIFTGLYPAKQNMKILCIKTQNSQFKL